MKKSFQLTEPGHQDARVLDAIRHEVRKYFKRERRKKLTPGVDFWDFDCKVGATPADAVVRHPAEVTGAIDAVAATEGATTVYVEILAKPGHRQKKATVTSPVEGEVTADPTETLPTEL